MLLVAIGIILTCFTTAGAVIDRILVGRHRSALHLAMVRWWSMIDDVKVPAFPALAARRVLHLGKRIFRWRLLSWQSLVICIALSWCVTSAAQLIACILDGEPWSILPHHLPI